MNNIRRSLCLLFIAALTGTILMPLHANAIAPANTSTGSGEFSLQVTPSPLVTTLKPGISTEHELKIRNAGTSPEELKIESRSFKVDSDDGQVNLDDTTPPDIDQWVKYSAPSFTIKPGEWFTQKVRIALPPQAGCSYSFAMLISRKNNPRPTEGGRLIKGSLAVFTLVNVDRQGCVRALEVSKFATSKQIYEYLPTEMEMEFKNTGNSIVQPYGNIYMQRGLGDAEPLTTLPVNDKRSYILPGSTRAIKSEWTAGFPVYKDGKLVWDWSKVADLRIGKYTAKLVAVYNDGQRDVPIEKIVSFWVVPWKILLGMLFVILLVLFAVGTIIWKIVKLFRRGKKPRSSKKSPPASTDDTNPTPPGV